MGTERKRYQITVNDTVYEFQGAAYVYDKIKKDIGAKEVTSRTSGASGLRNRNKPVRAVEEVKRSLPTLRLVMKPNRIGNDANRDQGRRTRRIDIFVDPDKYENAVAKLPNKKVGGLAGVGDFVIDNAYRPLRRCYR
ncbi:hypothetical protein [cf. Phormidesmis sp. LEGE 11477]|uniref:hypothetical protein n=1 Tax=cf. Phormidesmis sp. LEGE 11477 TaxID=1828680 RepID=UPI00187F5126|nr:hypothetical protein [cf. Phormidesmis sp. LEGE 11477]MBE9064146.1 hypothetical protein [cf. Phormidesmis sp. LEGE 11477]